MGISLTFDTWFSNFQLYSIDSTQSLPADCWSPIHWISPSLRIPKEIWTQIFLNKPIEKDNFRPGVGENSLSEKKFSRDYFFNFFLKKVFKKKNHFSKIPEFFKQAKFCLQEMFFKIVFHAEDNFSPTPIFDVELHGD